MGSAWCPRLPMSLGVGIRMKKIFYILSIMILIIGIVGLTYVRNPLIPTNDLNVSANINNYKTYKRLWNKGLYYLNINNSWYLINYNEKMVYMPTGPKQTLGVYHVHNDAIYGIPITDGVKVTTHSLTFNDQHVKFSLGGELSVEIK
jgi:hypothetical protein